MTKLQFLANTFSREHKFMDYTISFERGAYADPDDRSTWVGTGEFDTVPVRARLDSIPKSDNPNDFSVVNVEFSTTGVKRIKWETVSTMKKLQMLGADDVFALADAEVAAATPVAQSA